MARTYVVQIMVLMLVMIVLALGSAEAGTETEPEIWDEGEPAGDNGGGDIDIVSAWFHDEDVENQRATLLLHSLPPVQQDTDTIEYEIYFSTMTQNYSIVAEFDLGTGLTDPTYELRTVNYDNGNVTSEVTEGDIAGDWDSGDSTITYVFNKTDISGEPGDLITNTWAAVWITDSFGGDRAITDFARQYYDPGWDHYLNGLMIGDIEFSLFSIPDNAVAFETIVTNAGDQNLTINLSNTYDLNWEDYHSEKWDVTVTFGTLTIIPNGTSPTLIHNESAVLSFTIVVPADTTSNAVIEGKNAIIGTLEMEYWLTDLNNVVSTGVDYQVLVNTTGEEPGPDDSSDDDDDDDEFMLGLTLMQFGVVMIIAVVVVIVIIKAVV